MRYEEGLSVVLVSDACCAVGCQNIKFQISLLGYGYG